MQCSDCGKWRGVDDATLVVFSNETFFDDTMTNIKQDLLDVDPGVVSDLLHYLRALSQPVCATNLRAFWTSTENRLEIWREREIECIVFSVSPFI